MMINLSRVIHSPMMSQSITILRSSGIWESGEFVKKDSPETLIFKGIVTVASSRDLQMVPEGDRQGGAMKILTTERVYVTGEADGKANYSDVLLWRGDKYRINAVTPDADYGFYRAVCTRYPGGK